MHHSGRAVRRQSPRHDSNVCLLDEPTRHESMLGGRENIAYPISICLYTMPNFYGWAMRICYRQHRLSEPTSDESLKRAARGVVASGTRSKPNSLAPFRGLSARPLDVSGAAPKMYQYTSSASFPNQAWEASHYYDDLVFAPPDRRTYRISGKVSGLVPLLATINLPRAASGSTHECLQQLHVPWRGERNVSSCPERVGVHFTPYTAVVSINDANVSNMNFTVLVSSHPVSLKWSPNAQRISPSIRCTARLRAADCTRCSLRWERGLTRT